MFSKITYFSDGSMEAIINADEINLIDEKKLKLPLKYIINQNATILFWEDGNKTISKRHKEDEFDKELGFLYACWQYYNRNKSRNLRKKILECIRQDMIKTFLFERFRAENSMTVEEARKYLRDLKMEEN